MSENITILVNKNGNPEPAISTSGYMLVYLKGEEFKFAGTLELRALAPVLMKIAMEKMVK